MCKKNIYKKKIILREVRGDTESYRIGGKFFKTFNFLY